MSGLRPELEAMVERLPGASWQTAMGLGFLSAVFDNIPLTALAIAQGGYDWGMLAYTVGYGGSMIWFGSSAGVAISNMYPEAKSVGQWVQPTALMTLLPEAPVLVEVLVREVPRMRRPVRRPRLRPLLVVEGP